MRKSFNAATEELVRIDIETHPIFKRLFGAEGFTLMTEEALADFLDAFGLKMAVFADDPNERKTTIDMAVIAPELKKAFGELLTATVWADFSQARSLAARWGLRSMPAVALFRDADFLGAVQGLKSWQEYGEELARIAMQQGPAPRTIAILSASDNTNDFGCA